MIPAPKSVDDIVEDEEEEIMELQRYGSHSRPNFPGAANNFASKLKSVKEEPVYDMTLTTTYVPPSGDEKQLYASIGTLSRQIARKSVELGDLLGFGSFGEVYKGTVSIEGKKM